MQRHWPFPSGCSGELRDREKVRREVLKARLAQVYDETDVRLPAIPALSTTWHGDD
jgi:hypothetical protein